MEDMWRVRNAPLASTDTTGTEHIFARGDENPKVGSSETHESYTKRRYSGTEVQTPQVLESVSLDSGARSSEDGRKEAKHLPPSFLA
jgi:hypothetical protein